MGLFNVNIDSLESVLAIRETAVANLAAGLNITSWSAEGTSVGKSYPISQRELIYECDAFLREKLPSIYGPKITRTRPSYTS